MNAVVKFQTDTMTSLELLKIINEARINYGEASIRANDFHKRVEDELDDEDYETFVVQNINKTTTTAFKLNEDQCTLVAMRESKAVRKSVLLKLKAKQQAFRIPQTYAEALALAADQAKQLEEAAPKVRHYDTVVERTTLLTATQVGQKVKLSAVKLNKILEELDVYNKTLKRGKAFKQWFVDSGYGIMRQTDNGFSQPMFTTKGEAWVVEKLISEGVC